MVFLNEFFILWNKNCLKKKKEQKWNILTNESLPGCFIVISLNLLAQANLKQALTYVTEEANCMLRGASCYQNIELKC